jgi:hypothetical protein
MPDLYYPWKANTLESPRSDFYREISSGNIKNIERLGTGMSNPAIGATEETLWDEGGRYVFPVSASVMSLSSTSALDTAAGTGARTVLVSGLDADWKEITDTVTLNGTAAVNTAKAFFRINRLDVVSAGSTKVNQGILYIGTGDVSAGKPATVYGLVSAQYGISHMGIFSVPANRSAHWTYVQLGTESGSPGEMSLVFHNPNGVRQTLITWQVSETLTVVPVGFGFAPEKTDVEWTARLKSGTKGFTGMQRGFLRSETQ